MVLVDAFFCIAQEFPKRCRQHILQRPVDYAYGVLKNGLLQLLAHQRNINEGVDNFGNSFLFFGVH